MNLSYPMDYGQQKRTEEIRQVRRPEGQNEHDANSSGIDSARRCSGTGGAESVGGGGEVCSGVSVGCFPAGSASSGGILGQLLLEERDRLANIDDELQRLRHDRTALVDRIQYLEEMLERLKEISDK
jgi:hypothetical protein